MSTAPDAPARPPGIADWIRRAPAHRLLRARLRRLVVAVAAVPGRALPRVLRVGPAGRRCRRHRHDRGQARLPGVGCPDGAVAGRLGLVGRRARHAARGAGRGGGRERRRLGGARARARPAALSSLALFAALRLVNPLDGPLGEEPGWRGYALPELQSRRSPRASRSPPIVALWHMPLVTRASSHPSGSPPRSRSPSSTLAVQPHRWQRAAHPRLPRRAGHLQLRRARFPGADAARMDWLVGALWSRSPSR